MSLIAGTGVGKSFGTDYVIRNASFTIAEGERVGLVGPNGEGKTTLLRLVGKLDPPTVGTIQHRRNLRVGYLPQDPPALDDTTLWQSMRDVFAEMHRIEAELAELAGRLHDDPDGSLLRQYGQLQSAFESARGYDCDTKIKTVLTGLGFEPGQYDMPRAHLSGGQRTRGLLARLLLEEPDVLLLDEPTNHLDLEAVEWLERYLQSFRKALVVVSHDRYFLDHVTDRTWEVSFGRLEEYRGGYTGYVKKRHERFRERMRQWEAQQEYIAQTEEFIRRNLAGQRSKEARGRRTRLERYIATEAIARPREHAQLAPRIHPLQRTGDLVCRVTDLRIGYSQAAPLMDVGDLEVRQHQRVAILGPNGIGKTTLLRTVLGQLPPLRGEVRFGANVEPGYLPQTHECLRPDATVLEVLLEVDIRMTNEWARTLLGSFLFHGDEGRHAEAFTRYLEAEMHGEGGPDRLLSEIGMTPDGLDRAVAAYAKRINVR